MLHKKRNSDVVLEDDGEEEATQCYYDDHEDDDDADYDDFDDEGNDFGSLDGQLGNNRAERDQNYNDDEDDDDDRLGMAKSGSTTYLIAPSNAPLGRWRDSLLCCFRHGVFHPSLWVSLCCGPCECIVLSRLAVAHLAWQGPEQGQEQERCYDKRTATTYIRSFGSHLLLLSVFLFLP